MNNDFSNDILKIIHKKTFIEQWKRVKYKEKPIIIFGKNGQGKSMLADYILNNTINIKVDIDFCKNKKKFNDFLNESFYKKTITMMFNNNKNDNRKSLIIDDLNYIQQNDKILFRSIVDWFKNDKKRKNYKIILIVNRLSNKYINLIYKQCFPINIDLSEKDVFFLINKYVSKNIHKCLFKNTGNNLTLIKNHIEFYNNLEDINIDKENDDTIILMNDIIKTNDIKYVYRNSVNDYSILALNFLENCDKIKINEKDLLYIYESIVYGDYIYTNIYNNGFWDLISNIITFNVYIPSVIYKRYLKKNLDFEYNKYLSHSIIYTHNSKLLSLNLYNVNDIFNFYILFTKYNTLNSKEKEHVLNEINKLIYETNLDIKIINKFIKYYEYIFDENINKLQIKNFF